MIGAPLAIRRVGQPRIERIGPENVIHVFHDFYLTSFFSYALQFPLEVSNRKVVNPVIAVFITLGGGGDPYSTTRFCPRWSAVSSRPADEAV